MKNKMFLLRRLGLQPAVLINDNAVRTTEVCNHQFERTLKTTITSLMQEYRSLTTKARTR